MIKREIFNCEPHSDKLEELLFEVLLQKGSQKFYLSTSKRIDKLENNTTEGEKDNRMDPVVSARNISHIRYP